VLLTSPESEMDPMLPEVVLAHNIRLIEALRLDLEVGASDSVLLDPLNEDSFLTNLLTRFQRDQIYTYIGNVLLSINPYKPLALYTEEVIEAYRLSTISHELPPHVYALADEAWRSLRDFHCDQVIVITGESGSGKTEASKLILQYITSAAGRSDELETIRQQLLLSNPVLEAFGNAKTVHNDNSSRFGKYIELEFDHRGEPIGGLTTNYLLEKSRVTEQHPGERNFHIFYQLLAGADVQLLKSLKLQRNTENYNYLRTVQSSQIRGWPSDKEDFYSTKKALETVGFTSEEIVNIFRVVAAVLKLGNLIFDPVNNIDGTEGCCINNEYELEEVSMLLLISVDHLRSALLYRTFTVNSCSTLTAEPSINCFSRDSTLPRDSLSHRTYSAIHNNHPRTSLLSHSASMIGGGRGSYSTQDVLQVVESCLSDVGSARHHHMESSKNDVVMTDLNAVEATAARDTLCKHLYHRLFTWIVNSINDKVKVRQHGKRKVLAILDVYGFENVSNNSFEQLTTNYCNEKLHQLITEVVLKEEQEEYMVEGLEWNQITYMDNTIVCDLLEKNPHGIFAVLDEECQRPAVVTDDTFLLKLSQEFHDHTYFEALATCQQQDKRKTSEAVTINSFRVRHYVGWVTYQVAGFVVKNQDLLFRGLSQAMYRCSQPILKELFPEGNPRRNNIRRSTTSATQFKVSMTSLMKNVKSKNPHYVRCLKPNASKQPYHVEPQVVQQQIRYLGLLETTRVKRNGYVFRQLYTTFLQRYKMLSPLTWPHGAGIAIDGVSRLLRDLPISATEYAFGRTKIFIKNIGTVRQLEEFRRIRLDQLAILIQTAFRAWWARYTYTRKRLAQIRIATAWRRYKERAPLRRMKWRLSSVARKEYLELRQRRRSLDAIRIIERTYINWKRKRYLRRLAIRLPSVSPLCRDWPFVTAFLRETNVLLKRLYHKWRCHRYRLQYDQVARNRMREKVTASFLFRNRKESYERSVAHPFQGDYVRLRQNTQWRKIVNESVDHFIVFADIVSKITRSSGRLSPVLFVVSTSSMIIMDQRTLNIKYRVPAADVVRISLSPFLDDIAVFHVRTFGSPTETCSVHNLPGCLFQETSGASPSFGSRWKGDLVLQTCHVIELVTKIFLVVQNAAGKAPEVDVHTDFDANFGHQMVEFCFRCNSLPDVAPGQVRISRRGHRMEVTL